MSGAVLIGGDPGLSGALAVIDATGRVEALFDLPVIRDGRLAWIHGGELQSRLLDVLGGRRAHAIIERVGAMPKQGVASSFAFGVAFGSLLATLQTLCVSIELVTARKWKSAYGLAGSDKRRSIDKAKLLYPDADLARAKDHGRAEALLMARYALTRSPPPGFSAEMMRAQVGP